MEKNSLCQKGGNAALLLAHEDKITEAICFVLYRIVMKEADGHICWKSPDKRSQRDMGAVLKKTLKERFDNGRELLHCAIDQAHNQQHPLQIVGFLMEILEDEKELLTGRDVNGRTILHFAALRGHVELCKLLIEKWKMRADETDINKEDVLHSAVKGNNRAVFDYLCELDEVHRVICSEDAQKRTALQKVAAKGATEMMETLLSKITPTDDKYKYIRHSDIFGQTALLEAARGGHVEAVKFLLNKGSRPLHERNSDGRSALHYAVQLSNDERAKEMAELLLEQRPTYEDITDRERQYLTDTERSLFLWASATGSGTAEEACPKSSPVRKYLKEQRGSQSLVQLFRLAIELKHYLIAWELVKRGANVKDIKKGDWYSHNKEHTDNVLNNLRNIKNIAGRSGDQPAVFDSLGRNEFAEGLATLFLNPYLKSPLTVGICGEWGMGKSSLMIQTEIILLKKAAQLAFPNLLDPEKFPECRQIGNSRKVLRMYEKINRAVKDLLPSDAPLLKDDPLVQFLDADYQQKYHEVYKSLALRDRNEMFPSKDGENVADSSGVQHTLRKIPSIMTIQYNAWHYRNEVEAWAGLAVEVTKAIEESMTRAQRVRCRCRYASKENGSKILLELLLPILLALFLSFWVAWAVWELLTRSKHKDLHVVKYGSVPVTVLIVVWTVVRQLLSVIKPVSVQIMGYLQFPKHGTNLGYQHQVISDIKFLREEIGERPAWIWRFIAWLWSLCGLYPDTVRDTSIPRASPPPKDDIRMIVFIDDLDRCQDKVILQVLSAVNLVLGACNINVVLGMDMNMLERVMKAEFPQNENPKELAEKYIAKMVQLELALPDPNEEELNHFLQEQLGPAFEEGFGPEDAESETDPKEQSPAFEESSPDYNGDCVLVDVPQNVPETSPSNLSRHSKIFEPLRRLKVWPLELIQGPKMPKGNFRNMSFSMEMIMPNYMMEERIALDYLRKRTSGDRRLPREWKRFLIYHRIAWHILYQRSQVRNTQGWQQQLLVWLFSCWQWRDQMDVIIKNWKTIVNLSVNSNDGEGLLSLKSIVEHCYKELCLPLHYKQEVNDDEDDLDESEVVCSRSKLKEEGMKTQLFEDEECQMLEKTKEEWLSLIDTFSQYDVSKECLDYFQKFRLQCEVGDLGIGKSSAQR